MKYPHHDALLLRAIGRDEAAYEGGVESVVQTYQVDPNAIPCSPCPP